MSKGNVNLPPPEKDVEEEEFPASDSYTLEMPTFTPRVDDTEAPNDVDVFIEDQPSALSNGAKPVVMDEQENAMKLVTSMKMSCKKMMMMMTLLGSWVASSPD